MISTMSSLNETSLANQPVTKKCLKSVSNNQHPSYYQVGLTRINFKICLNHFQDIQVKFRGSGRSEGCVILVILGHKA